jgi:hypothetical protein
MAMTNDSELFAQADQQQDPYSAGFGILFKFDARIGGAVVCPAAARLLRVG